MHVLIKSLAISCAFLAVTTMSAMNDNPELVRKTDQGFQVFNPEAGSWGPEIYGEPYLFNHNNSAAAVKIVLGNVQAHGIVETATGRMLTKLVPYRSEPRYQAWFNDQGNIGGFCSPDDTEDTIVSLNAGTPAFSFIITGHCSHIWLSPDGHVAGFKWLDRAPLLINLTNGQPIGSIPHYNNDVSGVVSPTESKMLMFDQAPFYDPILLDMVTGEKIGERIEGFGARFCPDGNAVVVYEDLHTGGGHHDTVYYSTATGEIVKRVHGIVKFESVGYW